MKARHEFKNDPDYNEYIRAYFAAQLLATAGRGGHASDAEWAVKRAQALINALEAYIPGKNTFDY